MRPPIEAQIKVWGSCISDDGTAVPGEHLSEVTVMLRAKLRTYLQAVTEKLVENVGVLTIMFYLPAFSCFAWESETCMEEVQRQFIN